MIGVIVPAHNEASVIGACLTAIAAAARTFASSGEPVLVIVVADACCDSTADIARSLGVTCLSIDAGNVGEARRLGAEHALACGARWLAFTDADSIVPQDWLTSQLTWGAQAVCGIVEVADWSMLPSILRERYDQLYDYRDGHRHVHGANLGVCAQAYSRAGGFAPLRVSEDVALVEALASTGALIVWSGQARVKTSGRLEGRARGGFADFLSDLARREGLLADLLPDAIMIQPTTVR